MPFEILEVMESPNNRASKAASATSPLAVEAPDMAKLNAEPWNLVTAKVRIDSFNHDSLVAELQRMRDAGTHFIVVDLSPTRFIGLSSIRFLVDFAKELVARGGRLALIAPTGKAMRHFEIYGSLTDILMFRSGHALNIASRSDLGAAKPSQSASEEAGDASF